MTSQRTVQGQRARVPDKHVTCWLRCMRCDSPSRSCEGKTITRGTGIGTVTGASCGSLAVRHVHPRRRKEV